MPISVVDVVLGSLVLGLAGWALVQTASTKPSGRGCGGGCASGGCGSGQQSPGEEPLVTLGGSGEDRSRGR